MLLLEVELWILLYLMQATVYIQHIAAYLLQATDLRNGYLAHQMVSLSKLGWNLLICG